MEKKNVLIVVTARLASSRLHNKPLIKINSLPLVEHVVRQYESLRDYKGIVFTSESKK